MLDAWKSPPLAATAV